MAERKCVNTFLAIVLFVLLKNCSLLSMSNEFSDIGTGISPVFYVQNLPNLQQTEVNPEIVVITERHQQDHQHNEKAEDVSDLLRQYLLQFEPALHQGRSNLVSAIIERYIVREISLNELSADSTIFPYIMSLRVTAGDDQAITQEHIERVGQRFPGLRELDISSTNLQDTELLRLAQLPLATQLVALNISNSKVTTAGIKVGMPAFKNLRRLNISSSGLMSGVLAVLAKLPYAPQLTRLNVSNLTTNPDEIKSCMGVFTSLTHLGITQSSIGNKGLEALARQPFAANLTYLDIENNLINEIGIASYMQAFERLTHLNLSKNELGDSGLEALARQPFAPQLITLELSDNTNMVSLQGVTAQGIINNIRIFIALRCLDVSLNAIGDAGLEGLAQQQLASQLMMLNIGSTGLTIAGIRANIGAFTDLRRLDVSDNSLGEEGLDELAALPFARNLNVVALKIYGVETLKEAKERLELRSKRYENKFRSLTLS